MRAFEIYVNGKLRCTVGIDGDGVLNATLTHVKINARDEGKLRVGGLVSATGEHLDWVNRRLRRGDEVTAKVVETASADKPKKRFRVDPPAYYGPSTEL